MEWAGLPEGCRCDGLCASVNASAVSAARPPAPARSLLQINLSSFAYLFSEIVQYCQSRVSNIGELERK